MRRIRTSSSLHFKHFAPNFKKSEKIFETPYTNPKKYDIIELAFPADAGAV